MFCQNCGKQIPENAKFCNHCGAVQMNGSFQNIQQGTPPHTEQPPPAATPTVAVAATAALPAH